MSLYVPQDRIELHNALASQLLVRHADALSDRGISRDEACKFAHCATAREQIHASLSGGWPEFQAFIGSDGNEFGNSRSPEIGRLMERCVDLADLIEIERRSLRDAFVSGAVAAVAVDVGNRHLTAAYWRAPLADVAIKTGVADLSVDDDRLFSRFLIERDRFERWLNGSPRCGMRPNRREVNSSAASVSATETLDWEPRWNLDQTLIWIASRDIELVAAASSRLDNRPRTWVPYLLEAPDYGWPSLMPRTAAETELLHALQRSDLHARSAGVDVDPDWFCDAKVYADGPQVRAYLHGDGRKEPKFSSAEVRRIWPLEQGLLAATEHEGAPSKATTADNEEAFKARCRKAIDDACVQRGWRPGRKFIEAERPQFGLNRPDALRLFRAIQEEYPHARWSNTGPMKLKPEWSSGYDKVTQLRRKDCATV